MKKIISECVDYYNSELDHYYTNPYGCNVLELNNLDHKYGGQVPKAYKEYLIWMGKDYGGPFKGSECFYRDIESNNQELEDVLEYDDMEGVKKQFICFFSHQGYIYAWFEIPNDPDPLCNIYSEGEKIKKVKFSEFLLSELHEVKASKMQ